MSHPVQHCGDDTESPFPPAQAEKDELTVDNTGRLFWLLAAKRELISPVLLPLPTHAPPCSNFHPLHLAQLQAGLLTSFLFFPVTIKCHAALSCVLNSVVNWPQRFTLTGLNNSTKIIPHCTFFY